MLFQQSWLISATKTIKTAYKAQFNRDLFIPTEALSSFCAKSGLDSEYKAVAHFNRVIQYYAGKHCFAPSWGHLVSAAIPVLTEIAGWEKKVATRWPEFRPWLFRPAKNDLSLEYDHAGMFTSHTSMMLAVDFAKEVIEAYSVIYTPAAVRLLERVMYSLEYRAHPRTADFHYVIAAHNRMRGMQVKRRDTCPAWGDVHWSRTLVNRQLIKIGSQYVHFWEVPKVALSWDAFEVVVGKIAASTMRPMWDSGSYREMLIAKMVEFAQVNFAYLRFMLRFREEFVLTPEEITEWKNTVPEIVSAYPLGGEDS